MVLTDMRDEYDFLDAKRGPVLTSPSGKTRITIRIDDYIFKWFKAQVHAAGGGSYQTEINATLVLHRLYREPLETTLRRISGGNEGCWLTTSRARMQCCRISTGFEEGWTSWTPVSSRFLPSGFLFDRLANVAFERSAEDGEREALQMQRIRELAREHDVSPELAEALLRLIVDEVVVEHWKT
ncbi:MAG: BrnA antitoxin family protein [Gammaproteobacteria bacterium]|nr:BrnA antitoxin family protein [Gammaproteobacteria bacterium]